MPSLYRATVVGGDRAGEHGSPLVGIRLEGGATFRGRDVVVTRFAGAALEAAGNAASWLAAGVSSLGSAILHGNAGGGAQLPAGIEAHVAYEERDPWLLDIRYGANPDPRPRNGSAALRPADGAAYIGAFGAENWLEEWTSFGPEPDYDTREADAGEDQQ